MSGRGWTPGPLTVRRGEPYLAEVTATTQRGKVVVLARIGTPQGDRARGLANADLYAAAPDLFDSLSTAMRCTPDHADECDPALCVRSPCWPVRARAALAKASGGEK